MGSLDKTLPALIKRKSIMSPIFFSSHLFYHTPCLEISFNDRKQTAHIFVINISVPVILSQRRTILSGDTCHEIVVPSHLHRTQPNASPCYVYLCVFSNRTTLSYKFPRRTTPILIRPFFVKRENID